jgi:hypothetical protein
MGNEWGNNEVVDKFNYLGMTLESTGEWNKQIKLAKTKGYQALIAIDKCISVTPSIMVQMFENVYEMVCESKIMYGIAVWALREAWKAKDKVHSILCKKLMDILNCAPSGLVEMVLGRDRRGTCIGQIVK